jgi:hypothetical protein
MDSELRATAAASGTRYGVRHETVQQRVSAMMAYVVSEGRLFASAFGPKRTRLDFGLGRFVRF